jgi:MFS family permease
MIVPYLRLLAKKNFFLLCLGQITSQFGDKLTQLALVSMVGVLFKTSSATHLAIVLAMTIIPAILFSPITGVYVDRWSKRKTMYFCDFLRAIMILMIPLFFLKAHLFPFVCLIIFLSSSAGRFFIPAKMAFFPQLIKKNEIFLANSLISVTATSAAIFGFFFGGIIVDSLGLNAVFRLDAATFLVSSLAIGLITVRETDKSFSKNILTVGREMVKAVKKSFIQELKDGIKYIHSSHETKYAFRTFLFIFSYVGALSTASIRYVQEVLGASSSGVKEIGFIGVSLGAGIFLGSLVYGRVAHRFSIKKIINYSIFIASAFLIFFTVSVRANPNSLYAIFLSFILGSIISPIFIGVPGLIHHESQKDLLGRIFASLEFIAHLGLLIFMFISSSLVDLTTPFTIIISAGIIGTLFSIIFIFKDD